jgi:hypothetical protein
MQLGPALILNYFTIPRHKESGRGDTKPQASHQLKSDAQEGFGSTFQDDGRNPNTDGKI